MKMLLACAANKIMEYQFKFHFAVTTKLESYTVLVFLKNSRRFCSSLHLVTAAPVRFQSVPWLMKIIFYGKNTLWEHKFKCCSSISAFQTENVTGAAFEVRSQVNERKGGGQSASFFSCVLSGCAMTFSYGTKMGQGQDIAGSICSQPRKHRQAPWILRLV